MTIDKPTPSEHLDSIKYFMQFPGRLIDRTSYTMAGILDYDTTIRTMGAIIFVGLLLRAILSKSHLFASTVRELQATMTSGRLYLIESMA